MSIVLAHSSTGAGARTGATPRLCASGPIRHYRRSTTNKAPRKRTFLMVMTKYNQALVAPAGVASAFANNVAMLSCDLCTEQYTDMYNGDAGNNGHGSNNAGGNNNNGGGNNSNDGHGGFDDFASRFPRFVNNAVLGALAIITAVAVFPAQSRATASSMYSSPFGNRFKDSLLSSSRPPTRPRSKVMHVSCKGSTMVVPLTQNGDDNASFPVAGGSPWQRKKIMDAPIELSGNEVAIVDRRQYRVRESVLV